MSIKELDEAITWLSDSIETLFAKPTTQDPIRVYQLRGDTISVQGFRQGSGNYALRIQLPKGQTTTISYGVKDKKIRYDSPTDQEKRTISISFSNDRIQIR